MSEEDRLGPEDRLAVMRLSVVLKLYRDGGMLSHDQAFMLPMLLKLDQPAARPCIDEALRLAAEPHEKETGETDWTLRDSARRWLESDMIMPEDSADPPMTNATYMNFLIGEAVLDKNLKGKCARLWERMFCEIV